MGTLHLASSPYRMEALARQAGWAKSFGLPVEIVTTEEALERFPLIDASRVLGAQFVPTDGHIDPTGLTLSFAAGAKAAGARVRTGVRVEEVTVRDGRVTGVVTDHGAIEADVVVNAGGIWAHELGRLAGVEIPVVPMEHQYLITRPIDGVRADFPTLRDPDNLVYVREEVGGLVVGGYERNPDPWHVSDPIPSDFNHRLLPEKWERFESIADGAFRLIPPLEKTEINRFINGPEAFTPDDDFILGETEVAGFFVAAGFCAHGVTGAAGIGRWTAEWIVEGEPSMDLSKMDIRRFGRQYRSRDYALAKAYEIYAKHYDVRYPGEENEAGRPLRMAPTYSRLQSSGCRVRREGRLGASELVPVERGPGTRGPTSARLGRRAMVDRDRGRTPGGPGTRRAVRRDELREVRGLGSRRALAVAAPLRERRRRAGRPDRVHADAEPPRRDRGGSHRHASRRATGSGS